MGFTKLPNEIIELLPDMSESEVRVVVWVARQTAGWQRPTADITFTDFEEGTGLSRQGVRNGISAAMERGILDRQAAGKGYCYQLSVNEVDYDGLPSRPDSAGNGLSSRPQEVNEVDQPVNEVDRNGLPSRPQDQDGSIPSRPNSVNEVDHATPVPKERKETLVGNRSTNQPTNGGGGTNGAGHRRHGSTVEEALAASLLMSDEVGIHMPQADELAQLKPFEEIRRQVFNWLQDLEAGEVDTTGALVKRIRKGWSAKQPTREQQRSDLWLRFRLPSEREDDEAVEADFHDAMAAQRDRWQEAAAGPEDQPAPVAPEDEPAGLWSQVLTEIGELVHSDTMDALTGSRLEEAGEVDGKPLYRIMVAYPDKRSYIENRMGIMLRRTLGTILGHPVLIEVEAEAGEPA